MLSKIEVATIDSIVGEVEKRKEDGWRFITMTCNEEGDDLDFLYHFDRELKMEHIRVKGKKGEIMPSVSNVYFAAVVVENEIQDFYDVKFDGLAIDYKGKFVILGKEEIGLPCTARPDLSSPAARVEVVERNNTGEGGDVNG